MHFWTILHYVILRCLSQLIYLYVFNSFPFPCFFFHYSLLFNVFPLFFLSRDPWIPDTIHSIIRLVRLRVTKWHKNRKVQATVFFLPWEFSIEIKKDSTLLFYIKIYLNNCQQFLEMIDNSMVESSTSIVNIYSQKPQQCVGQ